jgi:thiamine biosynthesis lipoprotein
VRQEVYRRTVVAMGTLVTIQAIHGSTDVHDDIFEATVERAFEWFHRVEERCSRFDASSELMQLTTKIGSPVEASAILYEAVAFAVAVAEESGGAFDPTVGHRLETRGFNREHRTGAIIDTAIQADDSTRPVSYRDIRLDPVRKTITLLRPLIVDLGAVAKGLAIDMAARELEPIGNFAIDAGGDLYLGGCNADAAPWSVGIRHPRRDHELIDSIRVSNRAVCTSGDYERRRSDAGGDHHIVDPREGAAPVLDSASVTVIAPTAMLADALATAAFVLGPVDGMQLLERLGVDGLFVSPALERCATRGMRSDYNLGAEAAPVGVGSAAVLPHAERTADHPAGDPARPGDARQGR